MTTSRFARRAYVEWDPAEHPRDQGGRFATKDTYEFLVDYAADKNSMGTVSGTDHVSVLAKNPLEGRLIAEQMVAARGVEPVGVRDVPAREPSPAEKMMTALAAPDSGMTISRDGDVPTTGYIVAVEGHSDTIPAAVFTADREKAVDFVDQYLADHAEALDEPGMMLGLWHDPESGNIFFDVVEHVSDREEAIRLGAERDQIAIFDLGALDVVPTGGTGGLAPVGGAEQATQAGVADDPGRTPRLRGGPGRPDLLSPVARRAFTAENFDESLVVRDRGRFARKDAPVSTEEAAGVVRDTGERTGLWHLTDSPNFRPDPHDKPEWNSLAGDLVGDARPEGLFVGDPEYWMHAYGYERPYVAEIVGTVTDPPGAVMHEGREHFVQGEDMHTARVLTIDEYAREHYGEPGWVESYFEDDGRMGPDSYYQRMKREIGPDYQARSVDEMTPDEIAEYERRFAEYARRPSGPLAQSASVSRFARRSYVEWNPDEHPRGEGGRFVTSGGDAPPEAAPSQAESAERQILNAAYRSGDLTYAVMNRMVPGTNYRVIDAFPAVDRLGVEVMVSSEFGPPMTVFVPGTPEQFTSFGQLDTERLAADAMAQAQFDLQPTLDENPAARAEPMAQQPLDMTTPQIDDNQWRHATEALDSPAWTESPFAIPGANAVAMVTGTDEVGGVRGVNVRLDVVGEDPRDIFVPLSEDNFVHGVYLDGGSVTSDINAAALRELGDTGAPPMNDAQWGALHDELRGQPGWFEPATMENGGTVTVTGTGTNIDGERGLTAVYHDPDTGTPSLFFVPLTGANFIGDNRVDGASMVSDLFSTARAEFGFGPTPTVTAPPDRAEAVQAEMGAAEQILQSALPENFEGSLDWSSGLYSGVSGTFQITDPDGYGGNISFDVVNDTLHISSMVFDPQVQDRGLGTAMVGAVISAAEQLNVNNVEFLANITVGGYAWARMGAYPTDRSWDTVSNVVSMRAGSLVGSMTIDEETHAQIIELASGDRHGLPDIAALDQKISLNDAARALLPSNIRTDENGDIELGKALLIGTSWTAQIPIGDQAAREDFAQYERDKQAEAATKVALAAAVEPEQGAGTYRYPDGTLDDATFWAEVLGDDTLRPSDEKTALRSALAAIDTALNALHTARRAYVEFDPAEHPRGEHGRFTTKDEPSSPEADPNFMDPWAQTNAAVDRIKAAFPDAVVRVHSEITDAVGQGDMPMEYRSHNFERGHVMTQDYADAVNGAATGFERMAVAYPDIAKRIGTIELGPTDSAKGLGQYIHQGSGQKYGDVPGELAPPGAYGGQPRPLIQIDIDGLVESHALAYKGRDEILTHTVPSQRADRSMERLVEGVAVHEFGHAVYYAAPSSVQMHATADRAWSANQFNDHISDYAGANQHEYFAEAFTAQELGMGDRLNDADRNMLRAAGIDVTARAAAPQVIEDPPPDTFEGSIVWEYAQQEPRTAAFDETKWEREHGRFHKYVGPEQRQPWGDDASEGRPRVLDPRGVAERRTRYATEGMVRARLQAAFPNAEITGTLGYDDVYYDETEWLRGNVEPFTPEWTEEIASAEATAERVVAVYDGLEQSAAQFPEVAAGITAITMVDAHTIGENGDAATYYSPDGMRFEFSMPTLRSTIAIGGSGSEVASKEAVAEKDMTRWSFGMAVHEFGHALDYHAAMVEAGHRFDEGDFLAVQFPDTFKNQPNLIAAWDDVYPDHWTLSSGEVSHYATSEPAEYAAEGFTLSRLDPDALDPDTREIVQWLEDRGDRPAPTTYIKPIPMREPVAASVVPYTTSAGTHELKIIDSFRGDCVPVQYALGEIAPRTAAIGGPAEIIREIPDHFRGAFVEAEHPRDRGRFTFKNDAAQPQKEATVDDGVSSWGAHGAQHRQMQDWAAGIVAGDPMPAGADPRLYAETKALVEAARAGVDSSGDAKTDGRWSGGSILYGGSRWTGRGFPKQGEEIELPLQSFARRSEVGQHFAQGRGDEKGRPVLFKTYGDQPGVDVWKRGGFGDETEFLISGRYRVTESRTADGIRQVSLQRLDTQQAAAEPTTRRAFTAENFDESLVRREQGRFAHKDGNGADVPVAQGSTVDEVLRSLRGDVPEFGYSPSSGETTQYPGVLTDGMTIVPPGENTPREEVHWEGAKPIGERDFGSGPREVYAPTIITASRARDEPFPFKTAAPPTALFRAVSERDWQRIQQTGLLNSDARGAIETPGVEGSVVNADFEPVTSYLPFKGSAYDDGSGAGRVIRIDYRPEDGWYVSPGVDGYARTDKAVPIDRISMVSPVIVGDERLRRSIQASVWRAYVEWDPAEHPRGEHGMFAEKGDGLDASAADYGLNYQEKYVNDPDVLAAKKWTGWDAIPITQVDPHSLVAVEDRLKSSSIDKVVSGKEPLREGYTVHVVRKDDGTEIIVDGHHRAAMASALNRPLDVQIADARDIRARRAYTAENFDESLVHREHGRFARQDGGSATGPEPSSPAAAAGIALAQIATARDWGPAKREGDDEWRRWGFTPTGARAAAADAKYAALNALEAQGFDREAMDLTMGLWSGGAPDIVREQIDSPEPDNPRMLPVWEGANDIHTIASETPIGGDVHRAVLMSDEQVAQLAPGVAFNGSTLESWSRDPEVAKDFGIPEMGIKPLDGNKGTTQVLMRLSNGHGMDIAPLGFDTYAWQDEVVVAGDAYRIDKVTPSDEAPYPRVYLDVTAIPHPADQAGVMNPDELGRALTGPSFGEMSVALGHPSDEAVTASVSRFARRAFTAETFDESKVVREHGKFANKDGGGEIVPNREDVGPVYRAARAAASWWSGSKAHTDRIQEDADLLMTTGRGLPGDQEEAGMGGALMRAVELSPPNDVELFRGVNGRTTDYQPGQQVAFSLGSFTADQKWAESFANGRTTAPQKLGPPTLFVIDQGDAKALNFERLDLRDSTRREHEYVTGGQFVVDKVEPYRAKDETLPEGHKVWLRQTEVPHAAHA